MSSFATGKFALQICDRCGRRVKYGETKDQVFNQKRTGIYVCDECLDEDHPQLQLGRLRVDDPQSLKNPLTEDPSISRGEFGWRPVGPISLELSILGARSE